MSTYQPWLQPPPQPPNGVYGYNQYPYGGFDPNAGTPVIDPVTGLPKVDPVTGQPVMSGNGPDTSQAKGFTPTGNEAVVDPNAPMENIYAANRDTINTTGNQLGQEAGNQLNYYGKLQEGFQGAQNKALNDLQQTPGYNDTETASITGNPNAPVDTVNRGVSAEQGATDDYGKNLGAQLSQTEGWQGDAAGRYASGVGGASSGLSSGLNDAQSKFKPLDAAVNNSELGFDPNATEKQMTDGDVQNLVTSAGTTVGHQFQTAEDTLQRQAAAQGNTSPAAQAALRQQLVTQEGATAGDTMTNAQIAAKNAQFGRAQGIEAQREGAVQAQTGLKATAATTEEAAAQAAAGLAGQSNIAAQEAIGKNTQDTANTVSGQALNTANTYGQFNVGQQNTQTGQKAQAVTTADAAAAGRAKSIADQRITGQGNYRTGVQGQQTMAQQGGQSATQQQGNIYGTQTAGSNAAANSQSGFEVSKASLGDKLGSSLATLFADGGTADHDGQIAKVAESGPEAIMPPPGSTNAVQMEGVRYGSSRKRREDDDELRMAA